MNADEYAHQQKIPLIGEYYEKEIPPSDNVSAFPATLTLRDRWADFPDRLAVLERSCTNSLGAG